MNQGGGFDWNSLGLARAQLRGVKGSVRLEQMPPQFPPTRHTGGQCQQIQQRRHEVAAQHLPAQPRVTRRQLAQRVGGRLGAGLVPAARFAGRGSLQRNAEPAVWVGNAAGRLGGAPPRPKPALPRRARQASPASRHQLRQGRRSGRRTWCMPCAGVGGCSSAASLASPPAWVSRARLEVQRASTASTAAATAARSGRPRSSSSARGPARDHGGEGGGRHAAGDTAAAGHLAKKFAPCMQGQGAGGQHCWRPALAPPLHPRARLGRPPTCAARPDALQGIVRAVGRQAERGLKRDHAGRAAALHVLGQQVHHLEAAAGLGDHLRCAGGGAMGAKGRWWVLRAAGPPALPTLRIAAAMGALATGGGSEALCQARCAWLQPAGACCCWLLRGAGRGWRCPGSRPTSGQNSLWHASCHSARAAAPLASSLPRMEQRISRSTT